MPHSMTGFATADVVVAPLRLAWEIRSVNHRFLELGFRLPEELRALEPECRDIVGSLVKRGKVDCTLRVAASAGDAETTVVTEDALQELRRLAGPRARRVSRRAAVVHRRGAALARNTEGARSRN